MQVFVEIATIARLEVAALHFSRSQIWGCVGSGGEILVSCDPFFVFRVKVFCVFQEPNRPRVLEKQKNKKKKKEERSKEKVKHC